MLTISLVVLLWLPKTLRLDIELLRRLDSWLLGVFSDGLGLGTLVAVVKLLNVAVAGNFGGGISLCFEG